MKELTNDTILSDLNVISQDSNIAVFIYILALIIVAIFIIKSKKEIPFIKILILGIVLYIPLHFATLETNAIKYSIKHNLWSVESDTLERMEREKTIILGHRDSINYYAYLTNHGKVDIPHKAYENLPENQDVYIVTVKGIFGGTYVTRLIYPTNEFEYIE